jgi:hypothetical protein
VVLFVTGPASFGAVVGALAATARLEFGFVGLWGSIAPGALRGSHFCVCRLESDGRRKLVRSYELRSEGRSIYVSEALRMNERSTVC